MEGKTVGDEIEFLSDDWFKTNIWHPNEEWYDINLKQQESQEVAKNSQLCIEMPTRRSMKYSQVCFPKHEIILIKKVPRKRNSCLGISNSSKKAKKNS